MRAAEKRNSTLATKVQSEFVALSLGIAPGEAGARRDGLRDASVIRDPGASPHAARCKGEPQRSEPRMLATKCSRDSSIRSPFARSFHHVAVRRRATAAWHESFRKN